MIILDTDIISILDTQSGSAFVNLARVLGSRALIELQSQS